LDLGATAAGFRHSGGRYADLPIARRISIKVLYEDKPKGEMTCLLKWEPGATLPMHRHPEIEQTFVIEGSFYDHDGICRAGEFVWRRIRSLRPLVRDNPFFQGRLPPGPRELDAQ
jgi:hypothetical protein